MKFYFLLVFGFLAILLKAQPFIDPLNYSSQFFQSTYKDSLHLKNATGEHALNIFIPKKFKNENALLIRGGFTNIHSQIDSAYSNLYSISLPIGFQFVSKSKKWKTMIMGIPKINGDLRDNISKDFQYGGILLFTYVKNDSLLKLKFGLFYNRESFGNFFVPLLGIDWKATKRISVYGILPNNMRIEYKVCEKFYFGLGFKNYKRSYRLSADLNDDYVVVKETQAKLFAEFFVWKKMLLFADLSYAVKYDFGQFADGTDYKKDTALVYNRVYTPMNSGFLFTTGLAYRIRMD